MAIRVTWSPSVEPKRHADEPQGQRTWDAQACMEMTVKISVCIGEYTALHGKMKKVALPVCPGSSLLKDGGFPTNCLLRYVFVFEY